MSWVSAQDDDVVVHVVQRGDNLSSIARAYDVSVDDLRRWNDLRGTQILIGQHLRIPAQDREWYVVRRGDSLGRISSRFDLPLGLLRQLNDLDSDVIHPGQRLKLRPSHRDEAVHVVVRGETLSEIATDHDITLADLRRINRIEGDRIRPGQKLRLRKTPTTTHLVERGDALWEIARAYGMDLRELKELNGLESDRIYPGQELRVRAGTNRSWASYSVRRGDSLTEIAQLHQMSLAELVEVNALRGTVIHPGQRLRVRPILGRGDEGVGLLSPDQIPWNDLLPRFDAVPVIAAGNGPYYFARPRAHQQVHHRYLEEAENRPFDAYKRARKLWQGFEERVDRVGRLSDSLEGWHIVLDPGHGGIDPGTIVPTMDGDGNKIFVVEDEYVYDIAVRMYVFLRLHGAQVTLTLLSPNHVLRENAPATQTFVHERNEVFNSRSINKSNRASAWPKGGRTGLARRRDIAAGALREASRGRRMFISLHADHSPQTPEGVTIFYHQTRRSVDSGSRRFAQRLLPAVGAASRTQGRNLGVLRNNPADYAVLVEIRNLAYDAQAWALRFEQLRQRDAEKLVKGILDFARRVS
jgi:LysM repeat protein/N-acetylmuramoyl-L-alanine amidase